MHRTTPVDSAFRSYTAGGARSVVEKADDTKLMQEVTAHFMNWEARRRVEAPQNYGFTSYTTDSTQQQQNSSSGGAGGSGSTSQDQPTDPNYPDDAAESFIMFVGGNRSLPVAFPIDDRRNRLQNLKQGDVAMYRLQLDRQQIHMVVDPDRKYYGTFWSTRLDRINRIALVPKPDPDKEKKQPKSYGGQATKQPQNPEHGQQDCLDDNNKSPTFTEQSKDHYFIRRGNGWIIVTTDYVHIYNGKSGGGEDQKNDEPDQQAEGSHVIWSDDSIQLYNGNGHVLINKDTVETYYNDDTISTKVDAGHAHLRFKDFSYWVSKGGCHCTIPPTIVQDPDA